MQPQVMLTEGDLADDIPGNLPCCQPQIPVLAELLCSEPSNDDLMGSVRQPEDLDDTSVQSYFDPVLLHHTEVVSRLKLLESRMEKPHDYFRNGAKEEILPYMRKVVASWMLEVCEEQRCDEAVFPLAVAILDRFLATSTIKKEQLQLVACVCLLLASKTRQCNYFSLDLLSWYTDNSVSPQSLRSWELMILSQLNWDVNVITATDFVDFLLVRTPGQPMFHSKNSLLIRRHAITFIALCSTEPRFVGLQPSLIAASAIYTALKGVRRSDSTLANELAHMASVTLEQLISISSSIEQVISTEIAAIEQQTIDLPLTKNMNGPGSSISGVAMSSTAPKMSCGISVSGHNTPTDVQDIIV
ncbi:unnamed protein product [Allacma fusca]|uniref:Uncharacterized protein n=1 Tax=Allacma fusca TaxID=39272 RepID=A0A8J2L1D9_9HEXA|nr:unnamed protein product [Allacma fusca]